MSITIRTLVSNAMTEATILAAGESLSAPDGNWGLSVLRRILNEWNADRLTVWATSFETFTLVADLSPHTIGPTGIWTTTQRPVSIDGANLILPTDVNTPIRIVNAQWWLNQTTPTIETTVPTDLYYQPDWPDGKLYFWPVPTVAYDVELMLRVLLDDTVELSDDFTMPPGYESAVTLTLTEGLLASYGIQQPPTGLTERAAKARARVFANNDVTPALRTRDAGLPGGLETASRTTFNYLNRSFG